MVLTHLQVANTGKRIGRGVTASITLALGMLLAACANEPAATAQANPDQECAYVRVTGSNMPVRECRSRVEKAATAAGNRSASEELFRQNQGLDETGNQSLGADSLP